MVGGPKPLGCCCCRPAWQPNACAEKTRTQRCGRTGSRAPLMGSFLVAQEERQPLVDSSLVPRPFSLLCLPSSAFLCLPLPPANHQRSRQHSQQSKAPGSAGQASAPRQQLPTMSTNGIGPAGRAPEVLHGSQQPSKAGRARAEAGRPPPPTHALRAAAHPRLACACACSLHARLQVTSRTKKSPVAEHVYEPVLEGAPVTPTHTNTLGGATGAAGASSRQPPECCYRCPGRLNSLASPPVHCP